MEFITWEPGIMFSKKAYAMHEEMRIKFESALELSEAQRVEVETLQGKVDILTSACQRRSDSLARITTNADACVDALKAENAKVIKERDEFRILANSMETRCNEARTECCRIRCEQSKIEKDLQDEQAVHAVTLRRLNDEQIAHQRLKEAMSRVESVVTHRDEARAQVQIHLATIESLRSELHRLKNQCDTMQDKRVADIARFMAELRVT